MREVYSYKSISYKYYSPMKSKWTNEISDSETRLPKSSEEGFQDSASWKDSGKERLLSF
jgi:hypothetical protein